MEFCFFWFSRVFWFLTQSAKNLEKTKNKTLDTIWRPPWPHVVCGVLFFLVFSGFLVFDPKCQKPRENKKQNSRHYMATPLAPCSLWSFVFFCFFLVFSRFFCFCPKVPKTSRKQKKHKTLDTIWLPPLAPCSLWSFVFLFFLFSRGFFGLTKSAKNLEKTKKKL